MFTQILKFEATDKPLFLWFEPWAVGIGFSAGITVEIHAASEIEGELSVESNAERTAIFGWGGSTLKVFADGKLEREFDLPAPAFLTPEMTKMLFGEPPTPNNEDQSKLN